MRQTYRLKDSVKWKKIDDESLVLLPEAGEFYRINPSGTTILEAIQKRRDIGEIATIVRSEFGLEEDVARKDVEEFVKSLETKNVVEKG